MRTIDPSRKGERNEKKKKKDPFSQGFLSHHRESHRSSEQTPAVIWVPNAPGLPYVYVLDGLDYVFRRPNFFGLVCVCVCV